MNFTHFPLLAFDFLSPWLLWGTALGALPVIVHLLHKRKYRETSWAAMRFLLEAARKHSRRLRLEQLILLAVRVLILVLLALALAQPHVESMALPADTSAPAHRILVFDSSFSMGYQPAERSRFDEARAIAREIVSSGGRGDAFHLVRIADSLPRVIVQEPSYRQGVLIEEIDSLELTDERGDPAASLAALPDLLAKVPEIERKEIYVLSDFQRENWDPSSEARAGLIREQFQELAEEARLMLIDVSRQSAANAAVTRFQADDPLAIIDRPIDLSVTVQSFGGIGTSERALELFVDGRPAGRNRVELVPDSEVQSTFTHTFKTAGEHQLEVRLEGDALAVDDRRRLALPVREALGVLLVNGEPAGRRAEEATYYLENALAPTDSYLQPESLIRLQTINDGELTRHDLSEFDCVWLCNVAMFTEREVTLLESYVKNGGGLIISLGDQVNADNYNRFLYRGGEGLLPVRLRDRRGSADNPDEAFLFALDDLSHPIVSQFEGNPNTGLESVLTFAYFTVEPPEESLHRVALRFDSGDPAVVEAPRDRGRVVLLTTAVDDRWSTWTTLGGAAFVPVAHETVRFASAGRFSERNGLVGEPIRRMLPPGAVGTQVTIKPPRGETTPLAVAAEDRFGRISFTDTHRSGLYELRLGAPLGRNEYFAINVDPRESDLAGLGEEGLKGDLLSGIHFAYRTQWRDFNRSEDAVASRGGTLTRWLLVAVLCLVFVEQLMAWRFGWGLCLLYVFVAAAFIRYGFLWTVPAGIVLLVLFAGGPAGIGMIAWRRRRQGTSAMFFRR